VIRVPKVGIKKQAPSNEMPAPGKKQADTIKLEQALDRMANPVILPAPKGPLLDEAEKLRLQRMFEFNGKLPEVSSRRSLSLKLAQAFQIPRNRVSFWLFGPWPRRPLLITLRS
jgi:hypothetical protein